MAKTSWNSTWNGDVAKTRCLQASIYPVLCSTFPLSFLFFEFVAAFLKLQSIVHRGGGAGGAIVRQERVTSDTFGATSFLWYKRKSGMNFGGFTEK